MIMYFGPTIGDGCRWDGGTGLGLVAVLMGHLQVGAGRGVVEQVDFKLILLQIGKEEKYFKLRLVGKYNGGEKGNDLHASS